MIFVERNDLVDNFFWGIAASLRLLDLFRVAALLDNEVKNVEHFDSELWYGSFKIWFVYVTILCVFDCGGVDFLSGGLAGSRWPVRG